MIQRIQQPPQAALESDVGVKRTQALEECNEVLRVVAGSYDHLLSCGMRGANTHNNQSEQTDAPSDRAHNVMHLCFGRGE